MSGSSTSSCLAGRALQWWRPGGQLKSVDRSTGAASPSAEAAPAVPTVGAPIWQSSHTRITRGALQWADRAPLPVLVQTARNAPSESDLARMRECVRAFEDIARRHAQAAQHVWRPIELVTHENGGLAAIWLDCGGATLTEATMYADAPSCGTSMRHLSTGASITIVRRPIATMLKQAVAITRALHYVHACGITLHSVRPSAILYNSATDAYQFLDYSRSSLFHDTDWVTPMDEMDVFDEATSSSSDTAEAVPLDVLAYLSPEYSAHGGQANGYGDARSDLYGLGCTLYTMVQGKQPFVAKDAAQYYHMHLAAVPSPFVDAPPASFTGTPIGLSAEVAASWHALAILQSIVFKLMSKQPEERYQSAIGVLADLTHLQRLLAGHLPAPTTPPVDSGSTAPVALPGTSLQSSDFPLGKFDELSQYRVSKKLYGRAHDVGVLMDTYRHVVGTSDPTVTASPSVVLIGSSTGMGKSSVVDEFHRLLLQSSDSTGERAPLFLRCKFDLYRRSTSVLVACFDYACEHILAQPTVQREEWRHRLLDALAGNGAVLIDLLPQLAAVLGPLAPLPLMSAADRAGVFTATFRAFVAVLAKSSHALVVFIDDLQNADDMSLHLLHSLVTTEEVSTPVDTTPPAALPQQVMDDGSMLVDVVVAAQPPVPHAVAALSPVTTERSALMIIGCYRDNEIMDGHPLQSTLRQLREWDASHRVASRPAFSRVREISLLPLSLSDVTSFVLDSFHCSPNRAQDLAAVLVLRCRGTAWFVHRALHRFYIDGLIAFRRQHSTPQKGERTIQSVDAGSEFESDLATAVMSHRQSEFAWTWDLHVLSEVDIGADAVELLSRQILLLSPAKLRLLQQAACIGNRFTLAQLSVIEGRPCAQLAPVLWHLTQLGLLLPLRHAFEAYIVGAAAAASASTSETAPAALVMGDGPMPGLAEGESDEDLRFRFTHDSVQAAAYSLLEVDKRSAMHARIGWLLLRHHIESQRAIAGASNDFSSHLTTVSDDASTSVAALSASLSLVQSSSVGDLFDIADHFASAGSQCIESESDLFQVVTVLLQAGTKAKTATAWQPASKYLQFALVALHQMGANAEETNAYLSEGKAKAQAHHHQQQQADEDDVDGDGGGLQDAASYVESVTTARQPAVDFTRLICWERAYSLCFDVYRNLIECQFQTLPLESSRQLMSVCLAQTQMPHRPLLDHVSVLELRLAAQAVHASSMQGAVDTASTILALLNVPLVEFLPVSDELEAKAIALAEAGEGLPENMSDRELCVARVLSQMAPCAYLIADTQPMLMANVAATIFLHTLEHGTSGAIAIGLSALSLFLWWQASTLCPTEAADTRLQSSLKVARLCLAIDERYVHTADAARSSKAVQGRALNAIWGSVGHYHFPLRTSLAHLQRSMDLSTRYGDMNFLGHASFFQVEHSNHCGMPLDQVLVKQLAVHRHLQVHKVAISCAWMRVALCCIKHAMHHVDDPTAEPRGATASTSTSSGHDSDSTESARPDGSSVALGYLAAGRADEGATAMKLTPLLRRAMLYMDDLLQYKTTMNIASGWANLGVCFYLERQYATAVRFLDLAKPFLPGAPGTWSWALVHMYGPLARMHVLKDVHHVGTSQAEILELIDHPVDLDVPIVLAVTSPPPSVAPSSSDSQVFDETMTSIQASLDLLITFSKAASCNWQHRLDLVRAEQMRCFIMRKEVSRRRLDLILPAMRLYDAAIRNARAGQYVQDEALANELAGSFFLQLGRVRDATHYLRSAYFAWLVRSCTLKMHQMRATYSHLLHAPSAVESPGGVGDDPAQRSRELRRAMRSTYTSSSTNSSNSGGMAPSSLSSGQATFDLANFRSGSSSSSSDSGGSCGTGAAATVMSASTSQSLSYARLPSSDPTDGDGARIGEGNTGAMMRGRTIASTVSSQVFRTLDLAAVMRAAQAFSVETRLDVLLQQLMAIVLQQSAASRSVLLLEHDQTWQVELQASIDQIYAAPASVDANGAASGVHFEKPASTVPIESVMPLSVFSYVTHTRNTILLSQHELQPHSNSLFGRDPFYHTGSGADAAPRACPRSVVALPILKGGSLVALLYLENLHHDVSVSFTHERLQVLHLLCSQAALSIENARFTARLQVQNSRLQDEVCQRASAEQRMSDAKDAAEAAAHRAEQASVAKANFLSNMSHEIRTPMNAVLGMTRLLADSELSQDQVNCVEMISHSGRLLLAIISDILDYSALEANKLQLECAPFSTLGAIEKTIHLCSELAVEKRVELVYIIDPACPALILADETRIQQVLLNLLSNGIKFSNTTDTATASPGAQRRPTEYVVVEVFVVGPHASVQTDDGDASATRALTSGTNGGAASTVELEVVVSDTGIGMSPATLSRLFESFAQGDSSTRRRFGGNGLGLAISRRLTEAWGGRVWVESEEGVGSRFHFTVGGRVMSASEIRHAHPNFKYARLGGRTVYESVPASQPSSPSALQSDVVARVTHASSSIINSSNTSALVGSIMLVCPRATRPDTYRMLESLLVLRPQMSSDSTPARAPLTCLPDVRAASEAFLAWRAKNQKWRRTRAATATSQCADIMVIDFCASEVHTDIDAIVAEFNRLASSSDAHESNRVPLVLIFLRSRVEPSPRVSTSGAGLPSLSEQDITSQSSPVLQHTTSHGSLSSIFSVPTPTAPLIVRCCVLAKPFQHMHLLHFIQHPLQTDADAPAEDAEAPVPPLQLPTGSSIVSTPVPASVLDNNTPDATRSPDSSLGSPRATPASKSRMSRAIPVLRPSLPTLRILVAEDNMVNVKLMTSLLKRLGWDLSDASRHLAVNGAICCQMIDTQLSAYETYCREHQVTPAATAALNTSSGSATDGATPLPPSVVLMDVSMDVMDGMEATRFIRRTFDARYVALGLHVPFVIACTAAAEDANRMACKDAGCQAFITKPIVLDELVRCLTQAHQQHTCT